MMFNLENSIKYWFMFSNSSHLCSLQAAPESTPAAPAPAPAALTLWVGLNWFVDLVNMFPKGIGGETFKLFYILCAHTFIEMYDPF